MPEKSTRQNTARPTSESARRRNSRENNGLRNVVAGLAVVAALGGAGAALKRQHDSEAAYNRAPEVTLSKDILKHGKAEVEPVILVIKSGVNVRETPSIVKPDHQLIFGNNGNVNSSVEDDEVLVVFDPIVRTESDTFDGAGSRDGVRTWYGFRNPNAEPQKDQTAEELADNLVWVAADRTLTGTKISVYEDPRLSVSSEDDAIQAAFDPSNSRLTIEGTDRDAATAMHMSAADVDVLRATLVPRQ